MIPVAAPFLLQYGSDGGASLLEVTPSTWTVASQCDLPPNPSMDYQILCEDNWENFYVSSESLNLQMWVP